MVGASFVLVTSRRKISETDVEPISVAVTLMSKVPTFSFFGVPVKLLVAGSNDSHLGSAEPSDWFAE